MKILVHLWELILFLVILVGPFPACLSILLIGNKQQERSFAHFFCLVLTIWSLIQVSLCLVLGAFHTLRLHTVISLEILLFLVCLLGLWKLQVLPFKAALRKALNFDFKASKLELLMLGALALVGLFLLKALTTQPNTDYDSLWFHLPAIARWYQAGSLTLLDPAGNWIFEHPDAKFYPYNWHLLSVLFVMPFQEDFLVILPSLIAWVLLGSSIYLVSIEFGATQLNSIAGAALVLTTPMLLTHVNTVRADLPLAAFFIVGLFLAVSYHRSRCPLYLGLFLASLGMLTGIKTPGIIYGLLLTVMLTLLELKLHLGHRDGSAFKTQSRLLVSCVTIGAVTCLFLGSFWYIRNFSELQNQLASLFAIKVASIDASMLPGASFDSLFQGISKLQKTTLTDQFDPTNLSHWRTLGIQVVARLQLPFLALLLQAMLLPIALMRNQNKIKRTTLIFLSALLFLTAFLYWNTPYSSGTSGYYSSQLSPLLGNNMRYGYPFLGMLGVVAAVTATAFSLSGRLITAIVVVSSILGVISASIFDLAARQNFTGNRIIWGGKLIDDAGLASNTVTNYLSKLLEHSLSSLASSLLILAGLLAVLVPLAMITNAKTSLSRKQFFCNGKMLLIFLLLCLGILTTITWSARAERDLQRAEIYQGLYAFLDQSVKSEKLAYFSSFRSYLFYGTALNRQVLHVPLLGADQSAQWLSHLRENQIGFVAAGPGIKAPTEAALLQLVKDENVMSPVFGHDVRNEPVFYRLR